MLTLGIETSGKAGEIALLEDATVIESRSLTQAGRRHAQALVAEVDDLLRTQQREPADVDLVAVSIGPGSFTGLRVGVVFAKTWCYATGAKLAAVDTLQAVAVRMPSECETVRVISDAQRGELYVGEYVKSDPPDGWPNDELTWRTRLGSIEVRNAESFANGCEPDAVIAGPVLDRYESLFEHCRVAIADERHPRAATVAHLGRCQALADDFADFWTLEPFYIRKSAAEEKVDAN